MFKRRKLPPRMVPGLTRTEDTREFFIPQISKLNEKKKVRNKFVGAVSGSSVKDEVYIPEDNKGRSDIDKLYDIFREKKKLTKEEAKRRYGHQYYEFIRVDSETMKKAYTEEGLTNKDLLSKEKLKAEQTKNMQTDKPTIVSVSADEFFNKAKEHESSTKEEVFESEVLKDLIPEGEVSNDVEETKYVEEDKASDEILYQEPEEIMESEEIEFADDFEYTEYKPPVKPVHTKPTVQAPMFTNMRNYRLPPRELFKKSIKRQEVEPAWIKENIDVINQTLLSFGIDAEVANYTKGPTVTRYEIKLGQGVPTKKITNISDNIQMSLSAFSIRIEAPIPGKNTVGIEVPNQVRESVFFGDVIENDYFINSEDPLLLAIGTDIDALPVYTSIESMPHGLVAGSTQSGKSVQIAAIIASLIVKNKPDELKLMMIDPKKVDLQQFADIPHLITPIIDDTKTAIESLKYMVNEMEKRYDTLKKFKAINVKDYYSRRRQDPDFVKMPRIVIIIEEASDLLLSGGSEVEESILKLTQKSRAVGIHILLATQRPSADILKGAIKANIPTRFGFRVPSSTDSSVVLDTTGAEKLLGKGDMLLSENGRIRRLQGAFLSPEEIESLTDYIKVQAQPSYMFTHESLIVMSKTGDTIEAIDDKFKDVATYVVTEGKCSVNRITQDFGIGFNRATQIVNTMEQFGIVSPSAGTKPRTVLVDFDGLARIFEKLKV